MSSLIFVSYCRRDPVNDRWFDPASEHCLIPWLNDVLGPDVEVWWDRAGITGGLLWERTIEAKLAQAEMAILLVTEQFLHSEVVNDVELRSIAERGESIHVIPILVQPCYWHEHPFFKERQLIPGGRQPTPLITYTDDDIRWSRVRHEILGEIKDKLRARPLIQWDPPPPPPIPFRYFQPLLDTELERDFCPPRTILIVTGSRVMPERYDRIAAYALREEINRRGKGPDRHAVVITDLAYRADAEARKCPCVVVGGPEANTIASSWKDVLPIAREASRPAQAVYVQCDFAGRDGRVLLWGGNAEQCFQAVEAFVERGLLDQLLDMCWSGSPPAIPAPSVDDATDGGGSHVVPPPPPPPPPAPSLWQRVAARTTRAWDDMSRMPGRVRIGIAVTLAALIVLGLLGNMLMQRVGWPYLREAYPSAYWWLTTINDPNSPGVRYYLGQEYLKAGQTRQAIRELGYAVMLKPTSADSVWLLGVAYGTDGQYDTAAGWFEQYLTMETHGEHADAARKYLADGGYSTNTTTGTYSSPAASAAE